MPIDRINWLAVIVGGIVFFVWGYLWYGVIFAQMYARLTGMSAGMPTPTQLIVGFLMALVLSFGVAVALSHDDNRTAAHGAQFGVFFGIFFFASVELTRNTFAGAPIEKWLIDSGWIVLGLVILGLIHGAWKKARPAVAGG